MGLAQKARRNVTPKRGTLTNAQVAQLWVKHDGPPDQASMAAAVSTAESGRRTDIVNSIGATGLMQIYPGGEQYKDPDTNMKAAVGKYKAAKGWQPWTVCGPGGTAYGEPSCTPLKAKAAQIAKTLKNSDMAPTVDTGTGVGSVISNPLDSLAAISKFFEELLKVMGNPDTWKNLGKIIIGLLALGIGLKRTFELATT